MSFDPITELREADPAREACPDPVAAEALLHRLLAAPPTTRARPRRRRALLSAGAACLLVTGAALALLPRPGPGVAERAYAAVTPQEEILHVRSTLLQKPLLEEGLVPTNRRLTWEAEDPARERIVLTALRADGRERVMHENASSPAGTRFWRPSRDEIRVSRRRMIDPSGELTAVAVFRRLYRAGEVTHRGEVSVDGRELIRLSPNQGPRIDWLVDPDTFEPVVVRRYDESGRITQEERLTIERIPLDDNETRSLLELSPHPDAEVRTWDGSRPAP